MKKGFLALVVTIALVFASCGSNSSTDAPKQDSTAVNQDSCTKVAVADSSIGANGGGGDIKRNEGLDVK